jgi:hypothetical protein
LRATDPRPSEADDDADVLVDACEAMRSISLLCLRGRCGRCGGCAAVAAVVVAGSGRTAA